jgi:hypothetical protein
MNEFPMGLPVGGSEGKQGRFKASLAGFGAVWLGTLIGNAPVQGVWKALIGQWTRHSDSMYVLPSPAASAVEV